MDNPLKKINEWVGGNNRDFQTVMAKIKLISDLNPRVRALLDPAIAGLCQVANLMEGKLVLIAANGSIATQIRYQAGDLLRKFQQDSVLKRITAIECKVRPAEHQTSPRLRTPAAKSMSPLAPETSDMIKTIAESIEDQELKAIMMKIAARVERE